MSQLQENQPYKLKTRLLRMHGYQCIIMRWLFYFYFLSWVQIGQILSCGQLSNTFGRLIKYSATHESSSSLNVYL